MLRADIIGEKEFMDAVWKTVAEGKHSAEKLILDGATICQKNAIDSIRSGTRTGKKYRRTEAGKVHIASAPGEAPKSDTGALVAGITLQKEPYGYSVGSREKTPHGFWLEFGTSKIDPRPWLAPAFEKMVSMFVKKYRG